MPKGNREASKTLKQRFRKQALGVIARNEGKDLSTKEIGRRAMAQAQRHHDKAAAARHSRSKNPKVRAFASRAPELAASTPRAARVASGKAIRSARTSRGENPNTGQKQSALKTGRKAIKASVRRGTTSAQSGAKGLKQLAAMDPTTRRSFVGRSGESSARDGRPNKGTTGKTLSAALKAIRKQAKMAGSKTTKRAATRRAQ